MTPTAEQLERIVRDVLCEMGLAGPRQPAQIASHPEQSARHPDRSARHPERSEGSSVKPDEILRCAQDDGRSAQDDTVAGRLVVEAQVVTLAQLPEKLEGVRQVVVRPRAVVTPAVRDELRRRNVSLAIGPAKPSSQATKIHLAAVSVGKFDPAGLVGPLADLGIEVRPHRLDCLIRSSDWLSEQLRAPDTLGLLLTRHVAAALCIANRLAKIRAVTGRTPDEVAAHAEAVGANVLIFSPRGVSPFALKRSITVFCARGVVECPEALRERLG